MSDPSSADRHVPPVSLALKAIDRDLAALRARSAQPIRLGCSTISHDRLGYCAGCAEQTDEILGWRLLALRDVEVAK